SEAYGPIGCEIEVCVLPLRLQRADVEVRAAIGLRSFVRHQKFIVLWIEPAKIHDPAGGCLMGNIACDLAAGRVSGLHRVGGMRGGLVIDSEQDSARRDGGKILVRWLG